MTDATPGTAAFRTLRELKPYSFVFEQREALSADVCADMIERFEAARHEQYPGRIGQLGWDGGTIKRSTDLVVSGKPVWKDVDRVLFQSLSAAMREIREGFPFFKGPFKDMGYAIQRTQPGEYYDWHIDGGSHQFMDRQLVAIWYLNDVEGPGGATQFEYQSISVQPERGKLLLFPPFWTHRHRGEILEQGVKYIATTWVVFA